MRLAVAGGTGVVGAHVVASARAAGHDVIVLARAQGVDLVSGDGLAGVLDRVDAVVDVTNTATTSKRRATAFFGAVTRRLLAAEVEAGVGHHVALSIVGVDRVPFGYYDGKRAQEDLVASGPVPWTVLRATQFHEFPAQLLDRMKGPVVPVPQMRTATVSAREVAEHLLVLAAATPLGFAPELAGPETQRMPDLTKRVAQADHRRRLVFGIRLPGRGGRAMATGGLLPTGDGPRGVQTFDEWLAGRHR